MGQQQLLLVILVTIIVGIATVVAINTFSSAADSANLDAVRQDVATIAASAQGYYMKPTMLGGGGQTFTNVTFENLSFPSNGMNSDFSVAWNENGRYEISSKAAGQFQITASPASAYSSGYNGNAASDPGAATSGTMTATIEPETMSWNS